MPGVCRRDRGDYARMLFYFACEAAGASSARHSLRPLNFRCASHDPNLARIARRDRAGVGASSGEYGYARVRITRAIMAWSATASVVSIPPTRGVETSEARSGVARSAGWG